MQQTMARPRAQRHWHLSHLPALDGLRGLAVAGVLLYHGGYLTGGYLGVDLFFVLSGFLITSLLIGEREASGSVALSSFWSRRARRLLPALYLLLLGVVGYCAIWARPIDLFQIRGDAIAALLYVSNWRNIVASTDYWAISKAPSPLQHLWSLAIEEQFYVVWPLVVVAVTRRVDAAKVAARVGVVAAAGMALSLAAFVALHASGASDTRVYEGTDTRAFALLAGAVLASWRVLDRSADPLLGNRPRSLLRAVGPGAFVLLAVAWVALDGRSWFLYAGGLPLCSLLGAYVVGASVLPGGIPLIDPVLRSAPLRLLGLISYGLYLWHWPVYLVLNEVRVGFGGVGLLALRIVVSLCIAILSHWVVEQPIRAGALPASVSSSAIPVCMAVLALLTVVVTADGVTVADVNQVQAQRTPTAVVAANPTLLYVGDSVAGSVADYPVADPKGYGVNAYNQAIIGCGLMYEGNKVKGLAGDVSEPPDCTGGWPDQVRLRKPDAVVVLFGASPVSEIEIDGAFRRACDGPYRSMLHDRLVMLSASLGADGTPVVLVTNPPTTNPFRPGYADASVRCVNQVITAVGREGRAKVADLAGFVCPDGACRDTFEGQPTRPDSTHFHGPGGAPAARWLVAEVRRAAQLTS